MTYLPRDVRPHVRPSVALTFIASVLLTCSVSAQVFDLTIQLVQPSGAPIPNVSLQLVPTGYIQTTDQAGRTIFKNIEEGKVAIQSLDPNYVLWDQVFYLEADTSFTIQVQEELTLDEVAITALRKGSEASPAVVNMDQEDIDRQRSPRDIPYLLENTPGVVAFSDAGAGVGYTGMRIRGSDQTRINITLNGIPLNDSESQNVFFVNMPDLSSSLSSVQVQRGVGSSSNGAASFGASVNMSTHGTQEEASIAAEAGVGSFGTFSGTLKFNTGKIGEGFYLDGRASRTISDGYIDRASSDLTAIAASPAYIGDDWSIRYDLIHGEERTYQAWYGIGREQLELDRTFNPAGTEQPGEPYEDQVDDYQQTHHQLHYAKAFSPKRQLGVSLHYTRGKGFFEEYEAGELRSDYGYAPLVIGGEEINQTDIVRRRWLDNHFYGFIANYQTRLSSRDDIVIGAGANRYVGDHFGEVIWATFAEGIPPGDRYYDNEAIKYDAHIYTKYAWKMKPGTEWIVDLQYRFIDYQFEGPLADGQLGDRTEVFHFFNPKLALKQRLANKWHLLAYTGIAQKEPNREDFVSSSPLSQPDREWLWDSELGVQWKDGAHDFGLTAYYMHYRDQLALTGELNDVGAPTRTNVDRSYRLGVEFNGAKRFTDHISMSGHASWSINRVSEALLFLDTYDENFNFIGQTELAVEDATLPYSPTWLAGATLRYDMRSSTAGHAYDLGISLIGRYVSRQLLDLTGDEANSIPDYGAADVRIDFGKPLRTKGRWSIGVDLINVLNREYVANAWSYASILDGQRSNQQGFFPQAPFHWMANLSVQL